MKTAFIIGTWSEFWPAKILFDRIPDSIIFTTLEFQACERVVKFDQIPACQQRVVIRREIEKHGVDQILFSGSSPFVVSALVSVASGQGKKVRRVFFEALLPASGTEFYSRSTLDISSDFIIAASRPAFERYRKIRSEIPVEFSGSLAAELERFAKIKENPGRSKITVVTGQKLFPNVLAEALGSVVSSDSIITDDLLIQRFAACSGKKFRAFGSMAVRELRDFYGEEIFSEYVGGDSAASGIFSAPAGRASDLITGFIHG